MDTYQVRGFPTLLFVGPGGDSLGKAARRDADTLIQLMDQLAPKPGRSLWPAIVVIAGITIAVAASLVLVYRKKFASEAE